MGRSSPLVVAVAGLPAVGKGTLAKALSQALNVRYLDIDDNIRLPIFGPPHSNSYTDPVLMAQGRAEMGQSYDLLLHAAEAHLNLSRSVIVTATFSHALARKNLQGVMERHPEARLRVIWCRTRREEVELPEIERRLDPSVRKFGVNYFGGCTTLAHYLADKERYPDMDLPHLELDTFPPNTVEECARRALEFVNSYISLDV